MHALGGGIHECDGLWVAWPRVLCVAFEPRDTVAEVMAGERDSGDIKIVPLDDMSTGQTVRPFVECCSMTRGNRRTTSVRGRSFLSTVINAHADVLNLRCERPMERRSL